MGNRLENEIKQIKAFESAYHKATINLIYSGKWMIKLHSDVFHPFGISLQQYNILRILKGCYPKVATVSYIKIRMLDKMSDASRIVENMVKKGLISRINNSKDRRKVDITLAKKGIEVLAKIEDKQELLFGYLSNLTIEEAEQLNALLDKARS